MKFLIYNYLELDELPPAITLLKILLEQGHEITYISAYDNSEYADLLKGKIKFYSILPMKKDENIVEGNSLLSKIRRTLQYMYRARKIMYSGCSLKKFYSDDAQLWVLHGYTAQKLGKILFKYPYWLTWYELDHGIFQNSENFIKDMLINAQKVIVPEYCRAHILNATLKLKEFPYIISNKPYEYKLEFNQESEDIIDRLKKFHEEGKKIVLYSGIFLPERKLDTIIEALSDVDNVCLVFMGRESDYLHELQEKYPTRFTYLGFIKPPYHLEVQKYCDIGILTYVADSGSINPIFCAPNKIFEYARLGMPTLCNDIPGLKYTVETSNMGYCCDINDKNSIREKINLIIKNYNELSKNSIEFYKNTDVSSEVSGLLYEKK